MLRDLLHVLVGMCVATLLIHSVVMVSPPFPHMREAAKEHYRIVFIIITWPLWVAYEIFVLARRAWHTIFQRKNKEE